MRASWVAVVFVLVGLLPGAARAYGPLELEVDVHDEINAIRLGLGLGALSLATDLSGVARRHSRDMADHDYFEHENLAGQSPFDRIRAGGIRYQVAAENLVLIGGRGLHVASRAARLWVDSPGHYENIKLPDVTESGVGAWASGGTVYVTQLFLQRAPGPRAATPMAKNYTGLGARSARQRAPRR